MKWSMLVLAILLVGCNQNGPESELKDYAARVSNAIEQDFDLVFSATLPQYPAKRHRSLTLTELREGVIDVFDLRRCGLMELIGERNSSLGKLALPSQRLIYETRFLPPLRACIQSLEQLTPLSEEDQDLLERLRHIEQVKTRNYPRVVSNALFNSDEISQHFAISGSAGRFETPAPLTGLSPALKRFEHLADQADDTHWQVPAWITELETSYEAFYRSHFGHEWSQSLLLLTQTLDQTAAAIETRLARRPMCFNKRPTPQANIVRNVFTRYYAGRLQPWMSNIHRNGMQWRQHWQALRQKLPTTPHVAAYFDHMLADRPGSLWHDYQQARERHTQAWQQLLGQCGMMPGNSPNG
ncbi:DUF3080 family protein [Marinobacterium weihaiense]|uniref:DUF3080 domain-containing protein n=1 Tax=Marinobacterium weihaiense TaxID=2851016 RepID=A0ABS6M6U4_9GAMM|nr:DUF3080 family protein [Marinobacterium weihaiense]MBV0931960.1 DUF3080 domain-containing protein [Marinobacterium weihaiense]